MSSPLPLCPNFPVHCVTGDGCWLLACDVYFSFSTVAARWTGAAEGQGLPSGGKAQGLVVYGNGARLNKRCTRIVMLLSCFPPRTLSHKCRILFTHGLHLHSFTSGETDATRTSFAPDRAALRFISLFL